MTTTHEHVTPHVPMTRWRARPGNVCAAGTWIVTCVPLDNVTELVQADPMAGPAVVLDRERRPVAREVSTWARSRLASRPDCSLRIVEVRSLLAG